MLVGHNSRSLAATVFSFLAYLSESCVCVCVCAMVPGVPDAIIPEHSQAAQGEVPTYDPYF